MSGRSWISLAFRVGRVERSRSERRLAGWVGWAESGPVQLLLVGSGGGGFVFWYNQSGPDSLWLSTGGRYFSDTRSRDMGLPPPGGHTAVSGDFDGTGGDDLIWFAPSGADMIWKSHQSPFDTARQIAL